ncbi:GL26281 [Drosophila persimilis]|uniref:GL26281 n=1 Tax=Drosophila persimilis TaxID=7234 RepID=B4GUM5_DROPE|nr:GL26281 [Drosophila persimilis]
MCRAWMCNQTRHTALATCNKEADNATGQQQREDNAEEVLAQIKSGMIEMLSKVPQARSTSLMAVPPALVYTEQEKMEDEMLHGAPEAQLLAANVARWKRIGKHWQEHARTYNRERYELLDKIMDEALLKKEKE